MDTAGKNALKRLSKVFLIILIISLTFSVAIFIFTSRAGVSFIAVKGSSMSPTFENNDTLVLVQEKEVERGQIALVAKPKKWKDYKLNSRMIKRIVGIPNDSFSYDGKVIKVNDEVIIDLDEDGYECDAGEIGFNTVLKEDQFLILGDNKTNSLDSIRIFCDGNSDLMFLKNKNIINNGTVRYVL